MTNVTSSPKRIIYGPSEMLDYVEESETKIIELETELAYSWDDRVNLKKEKPEIQKELHRTEAFFSEFAPPYFRSSLKSANEVSDESDKKLETTFGGQGTPRIETQHSKPPLLARVDRFAGEKVRCIVDFKGFPLPVAFPIEVIKHHNLSVGDEFDWFPAKGRPAKAQDCEPLRDKPAFAPGEKEELDRLISTLPSYDD